MYVDGALLAVEEINCEDDCPKCGAVGHPNDNGKEAWRECANAHRWAVEVRSETEEETKR